MLLPSLVMGKIVQLKYPVLEQLERTPVHNLCPNQTGKKKVLHTFSCITAMPSQSVNNTVQCSSVQCSAVQCIALQCTALQCSAVQCSAVQCSIVKYNAVQCSAVQYIAVQYSTVECSGVQYSEVEWSGVECMCGRTGNEGGNKLPYYTAAWTRQCYTAEVLQCSSVTVLWCYSAQVLQCGRVTFLKYYSAEVLQC